MSGDSVSMKKYIPVAIGVAAGYLGSAYVGVQPLVGAALGGAAGYLYQQQMD